MHGLGEAVIISVMHVQARVLVSMDSFQGPNVALIERFHCIIIKDNLHIKLNMLGTWVRVLLRTNYSTACIATYIPLFVRIPAYDFSCSLSDNKLVVSVKK